ncbi:hypothetical protein FDF26_17550 [Clostridium botulinum]|uniref:hypothetical protein n=1 Tax=Clostridium botulinum TaxID=1491 RepID=UPI0013F00B1F|nr:hypothetical protein [Clostridium botulinum]MBY6838843.1 hypothetical protein [Clostridium botulinum]NFH69035.1 hypothetical protein [Clostridium botulinum]NFO41095.1 hypothetical protein [Clostridium botulinum]NFP00032.1 hypothetical protein [Clostridium botulinum]NFT08818.1 hypothetical protein [Clostridium botulinum]
MLIKRYKCNISIFDIRVRLNGGVDMATISFERDIKLSPKAVNNIFKIINKPSKYEKEKNSNVMSEIEEGRKLLKQLFSH